MKSHVWTIAIVAVCAAPLAAQTEIKDNILTTSGKRIRGVEVTAMSATTIKYTQSGDAYDLPAASLTSIEWSDPPEPFVLAQAAERSGQFAKAAGLYDEAIAKTERAVFANEIKFLAARALVRASGADPTRAGNAVAKLTELLASDGEAYRAAAIRLELGRAQLLAGDPASAEETLRALGDVIAAQALDPMWDVRAKFAIAQAQLAQGKLPDARASFRRAKSTAESALAMSSGPAPELAEKIAEAVVGEGQTFIVEQKFDDATRYYERFERDDSPAIAAAAMAGHGEALYLKSQQSGNSDDLRAAQLLLARANVLDPLAGTTTAKALYYSGKVILALGPDRESQEYATRANQYFEAAAKHYSDTEWGAKAAAEIK